MKCVSLVLYTNKKSAAAHLSWLGLGAFIGNPSLIIKIKESQCGQKKIWKKQDDAIYTNTKCGYSA